MLAACSTFLAFIVRLPVSDTFEHQALVCLVLIPLQVPEKALGQATRPRRVSISANRDPAASAVTTSTLVSSSSENLLESGETTPDEETDEETSLNGPAAVAIPSPRNRRLSTYEDVNGSMDYENDRIGGSARQTSFVFKPGSAV